MIHFQETVRYIIHFLSSLPEAESAPVYYGDIETAPIDTKIVIVPAYSNFEITALPETPFKKIDDTPILFGDPRIEKKDGRIILYADIIASSYFLLSRHEEVLKPDCRDQHGRFRAKDSIIFQSGYGNRPLVDEYGILLRKWLREVGVTVPEEKQGFSKIYLTHDVDAPFRFERFSTVCKQWIKNLLHYHYVSTPLKQYRHEQYDEFYTFPKIIKYDNGLKESLPDIPVQSIYFLISAGSFFNRKYYNFLSKKTSRLINTLSKSDAKLGLHVSYEAGVKPEKIAYEAERLRNKLGFDTLISRHHFLQWRESEDVVYMEQAGITDDFTLSYADSVGFRVGTCRPYRFINPRTKTVTNVVIHPLLIMECTLDRPAYMNLDYEDALAYCKVLIDQVYKHNGELVLLWHNTEFLGLNYQERLYKSVLEYIKGFN
ncbi:hypothetical protein AGMMS49579_17900 [Spirochaetia bacterium]|nr:hypothetical protein AGMMS49579_17900 [Spirochaetia bacterium]